MNDNPGMLAIDTDILSISANDNAKRHQILDGARKVFRSDGFDGASMNEIARVAGVSKGTLYVYFDSKEGLFEELIRADKRLQTEQLLASFDDSKDIRSVLREFGENLMLHMFDGEALAQVRTIIGISGKLPQVGRAFYEAGPAFGIATLSGYLDRKVAGGLLAIDDTRFAAIQFVDMCQAGAIKARLFGVEVDMSPPRVRKLVDRACTIFMKLYKVERGG